MASSNQLDLEITIISAKHLKNVNWRNGDLKPYATFYLDPDHRLSTRPDNSGSTRPVWNERFTLHLTRPLNESFLNLEVFHSKPSETPKPLVGALNFNLSKLAESDDSAGPVHALELLRPSGRPQGKIRLKLALRERPSTPSLPLPDYYVAPHTYYNNFAPPPPPPPASRDYRDYSPSPYSFSEHYPSYYSAPPPLPSRPFVDRASNYTAPSDPSAPVEFPSSNEHKLQHPPPSSPARAYNYAGPSGPSAPVEYSQYDPKPPRYASLEEGMKYEEGRVAEKVESNLPATAREGYSYSNYRHDH